MSLRGISSTPVAMWTLADMKTATDADVDYVLSVVPEAVDRLRALSPVEAGTLG